MGGTVQEAPRIWAHRSPAARSECPRKRGHREPVDIEPEAPFVRHQQPGKDIIYVLEGSLEYQLKGQEPRTLSTGDVLLVAAEMVHAVKNVGSGNASELATFFVEKDEPLLMVVQ